MYIRVGYDIAFNVPADISMLLNLNLHPTRLPTAVRAEALRVEPMIPIGQFNDSFGNTCTRLNVPAGNFRVTNDAVVYDSGEPDPAGFNAVQHTVDQLPPDTLQFLLASRYCEVDLLKTMAWNLFGHLPKGWALAQGICDYVHRHITFGYQHARVTRTAHEGHQERVGVCRDFAHLAVALTRCMNIPARYVTGYLGDIGIPPVAAPMDFSAWYEVYLGGRWWTLDARHNTPRIGRVLMARGRDATDVALTTAFGTAYLSKFQVWTDEVPGY